MATIGVITISVLIFSAFSLIAFNLASFLKIWEDKIEVIAYLKRKTPASEVETLFDNIRQMGGVESVKYVSPSDAMAFMEAKLGRQKNLLEGIQPTDPSPFPRGPAQKRVSKRHEDRGGRLPVKTVSPD